MPEPALDDIDWDNALFSTVTFSDSRIGPITPTVVLTFAMLAGDDFATLDPGGFWRFVYLFEDPNVND